MIRIALLFISFVSFPTFAQDEHEAWYIISDSLEWSSCGYVNQNGDTIVPLDGACFGCYTDSLPYAILALTQHLGK